MKTICRRFHRQLRSPPRASLVLLVSPIQQAFFKTPPPAKYFSCFIAAAWSLKHLHPNTWITLGPPVAFLGWSARRKWHNKLYTSNILKVFPETIEEAQDENNQILLKPYDESDIENVVQGIESEFDHFRAQLLPLVERKLVDYVVLKGDQLGLFVENDQVLARLSGSGGAASTDLDTFMVLPMKEELLPYNKYTSDLQKGELERIPQFEKFIKISLPFLRKEKRVSTVEIYLLQHKDNANLYKLAVGIAKYGLFGGKSIHIRDFESGGRGQDREYIYV